MPRGSVMTVTADEADAAGERGRDRSRERHRETDRFAALGLARDPFPDADLHLECYLDGARERHLEALANLRGLGRPLVLVTGPEGVGRTSFFHALLRRLPDDVPVVRVTAGVFLSARNLLQAVARAMGLATDPEEERAALRERLEQEIFELGRSQVFCAVLVDDADELEAEALEELISLAELSLAAGGVRVILFGGPGLRRVLVDVAGDEQIDFLAFDVALEALSINDLRTYLQFRLSRAGHRGASPFSEEEIQQIYRRSGGLPRLANGVARELLLARRRHWLALPSALWLRMPGGFAPQHVAGAGVGVLLVALFAWLLWPAVETPPGRDTAATGVPTAAVLEDAWLPLPEPSGAAELPASPLPPAGENPAVAEVVLASPPASGDTRQAEVEPAAPPEPVAPPPARAAPQPERSPPETAPEAVAEPAATERHPLLERDATRYVLQVLGTSSRSNGEAWIAAQNDGGFMLVEREREGRPWFVVFYGDFATRSAAIDAVPRVAGATGTSPWVRIVAEVRAEILGE